MKKKLLSPLQLKEFYLQQEEQKKIRAAELERKKLEEEKRNRRVISPKELLDPKPVVEVVEEPAVEPPKPRDAIEILQERVEELAAEINKPSYFDEEISRLEVLISNKAELNEVDLGPLNYRINQLKEYISELPKVKYYDEDLEKLTERVDQLQISGSEIFQQHGENLKEIKKVIHQMLKDLVKLDEREIPEVFDPTDIHTDIAATKETFYERVAEIKKELSALPEVRYYDDELSSLREQIETVRNSIPKVPDIKYYDEDLENLLGLIEEVRGSIPELPEVRYYENEIAQLEEAIKSVEDRIPTVPEVRYYEDDIGALREEIKNIEGQIPEVPEIPEIKYYDEEIEILSEDIDKVRDSLIDIKLAIRSVEKSVTKVESLEIPEAFDPTGLEIEIEKAFKEIEKLKEQPVTVKEDIDPLLPLEQKFVTFDDLANHYRTFINRVQQQLMSLGGGGEVNLRYLDDIDRSSISNGKVLSYDAATKKFKFISPGAASSLWSEQGDNIYRNSNVGINSANPQVALDVVGDVSITGVITATSFYGDGSNLTGVNADTAAYATNAGISSYADVAGIATVAENLTGSPSINVTNIIGVDATFTGNVSIAGTLTYEDVTNIDAIGLVTARSGIEIGFPGTTTILSADGNATFSGVVTATAFTGEFVSNLDKTLEYQSGTLSTITTSEGTKTFYYDGAGILTSIVGTGVYVSKTFSYDGNGNLISVNVL